jgi:hypothetical protein
LEIVDIFYGRLEYFYGHLVYFMTIWYSFVFILAHFSGFGIMYQEKSGNPAASVVPTFETHPASQGVPLTNSSTLQLTVGCRTWIGLYENSRGTVWSNKFFLVQQPTQRKQTK